MTLSLEENLQALSIILPTETFNNFMAGIYAPMGGHAVIFNSTGKITGYGVPYYNMSFFDQNAGTENPRQFFYDQRIANNPDYTYIGARTFNNVNYDSFVNGLQKLKGVVDAYNSNK